MTDSRQRCVVLDDYQSVAARLADWESLADRVDVSFEPRHLPDRATLAARLAEADLVLANRERTVFDEALLAELPRLKLLVTMGMGNAAIDMAAARVRGIDVCGTNGAGEPTVELTWALILGLARHVVSEANALRAGEWQTTLGLGLKRKTLGLVGLGRVAIGVAAVARAFGMRVMAWSPNLTQERAQEAGVEMAANLETLFATADVISLHAGLNTNSRGLVGAELLGRMQSQAVLINTARADLLDEAALITILRDGGIAGAALDVFATEPLRADHPLLGLPNVLATPHLGYVTADNYRSHFGEAVENIKAWLAGSPLRLLN